MALSECSGATLANVSHTASAQVLRWLIFRAQRLLRWYAGQRFANSSVQRVLKHYACASLSTREPPNITLVHVSTLTKDQTPVQVRAFTEHQLRLCKFERSRTTKHYTCACLSAQGRSKHYICKAWERPALEILFLSTGITRPRDDKQHRDVLQCRPNNNKRSGFW